MPGTVVKPFPWIVVFIFHGASTDGKLERLGNVLIQGHTDRGRLKMAANSGVYFSSPGI